MKQMKALLSLLLSLSLGAILPAGAALGTQSAADTVVIGDINADGAINASDALLSLQHSVNIIRLGESEQIARRCGRQCRD